jgi:hypothetical protein
MSLELEASGPPWETFSLPEIADDVPLPPRYSSMLDSKGRVYYLDHEKKTTQWLNPVKATEFRNRGMKGIDLCFRRTTTNGLEYLVNYSTGYVVGPHWNGSYSDIKVANAEGKLYSMGFKEGKLDASVRGPWPQEVLDRIEDGNPPQYTSML